MSASIRATGLALLFAFSGPGCGQPPAATTSFEPSVGQAGKDVVWVPTPQALVDRMLDMAKVTAKDYVMDLGSGDGRTVITAAKRGARATGIEFNPDMVELSRANAQRAGVTDRANFLQQDLFKTDFSKATVITMFLLPGINVKLRPKILALKPGTRVVSNTFTMDKWEPDQTETVGEGCDGSWCTALLWYVPARVEGSHKTPKGEFALKQQFQMVSGTLQAEGRTVPVEGRVRGEEVTLTAGGQTYKGRMNGKTLELH